MMMTWEMHDPGAVRGEERERERGGVGKKPTLGPK
jgi:hypothetical protein